MRFWSLLFPDARTDVVWGHDHWLQFVLAQHRGPDCVDPRPYFAVGTGKGSFLLRGHSSRDGCVHIKQNYYANFGLNAEHNLITARIIFLLFCDVIQNQWTPSVHTDQPIDDANFWCPLFPPPDPNEQARSFGRTREDTDESQCENADKGWLVSRLYRLSIHEAHLRSCSQFVCSSLTIRLRTDPQRRVRSRDALA